jgi:hypothetical protein
MGSRREDDIERSLWVTVRLPGTLTQTRRDALSQFRMGSTAAPLGVPNKIRTVSRDRSRDRRWWGAVRIVGPKAQKIGLRER